MIEFNETKTKLIYPKETSRFTWFLAQLFGTHRIVHKFENGRTYVCYLFRGKLHMKELHDKTA